MCLKPATDASKAKLASTHKHAHTLAVHTPTHEHMHTRETHCIAIITRSPVQNVCCGRFCRSRRSAGARFREPDALLASKLSKINIHIFEIQF